MYLHCLQGSLAIGAGNRHLHLGEKVYEEGLVDGGACVGLTSFFLAFNFFCLLPVFVLTI